MQPIKECVIGTKFVEILSIINRYIEISWMFEHNLKHDLVMFVGKGIKTDLDNLSDSFKQGIHKAFLNGTERV